MGKLGNPLRRPWTKCFACDSKNVSVQRIELSFAKAQCNACGAYWDGFSWHDKTGKDIGAPTFGRYGNFT